MPGFEAASRARSLARLAEERFDLLVVGGGITGAGVAREAASRGLTVALVEARDFAAGTSSRSSKLIHGGLRYLEQGDIGLVREAASERRALRRIAPHLAIAAPMLVPVYGRTATGVYKLRVGLSLYDRLAGVPPEERYRILSRDEALAAEPCLARERLQGAAFYPEYVTDDARLVLATLKSAHHAGAVVANYTRVVALGPWETWRAVHVRDDQTGADLVARARVIVNAAGPWVDALRALDEPNARPRLHLTKGVHIVFTAHDLPVRHCVVMQAPDGRPVFTVARGPHVYVGTTDTSYEGPLDEPTVQAEDVEYLLASVRRTLPGAPVAARDVVGTWAGLRPLVHEDGKRPSEISRKDEIVVSDGAMITIAGGKLTTYRCMAERVLEAARPLLGGRTLPPSGTADRPLAGGDLGPAADLDGYASSATVRAALEGVPAETAARLLAVHGSDALEVVRMAAGPRAVMPLAPDVPLSEAEVHHAVRCEMACTLADVLERRSRIALFATETARAIAPRVATIMAEDLGWPASRVAAEIDAFTRAAAVRLAWRDVGAREGGTR